MAELQERNPKECKRCPAYQSKGGGSGTKDNNAQRMLLARFRLNFDPVNASAQAAIPMVMDTIASLLRSPVSWSINPTLVLPAQTLVISDSAIPMLAAPDCSVPMVPLMPLAAPSPLC